MLGGLAKARKDYELRRKLKEAEQKKEGLAKTSSSPTNHKLVAHKLTKKVTQQSPRDGGGSRGPVSKTVEEKKKGASSKVFTS